MENLLNWKTLENAQSAIYSFQFHHYLIQLISHWCVPLKWQTEEKIERDRVSNLCWFGIDAIGRSMVDVHAAKPWVCIWRTYCNIWETRKKNIKQTKNNSNILHSKLKINSCTQPSKESRLMSPIFSTASPNMESLVPFRRVGVTSFHFPALLM